MKHMGSDQFGPIARGLFSGDQVRTRSERLERWAQLVEARGKENFSTLPGTEHQPSYARHSIRISDSPISVAFSDGLLRAAGLADDTYGEARRFFDLNDDQLHEIICHCRTGTTVTAEDAARQIRSAIQQPTLVDNIGKILFVAAAVTSYGGLIFSFSLYIAG